MKHSQLFIDSLIHPGKLAVYRMLSIGKVLQYVFLLITAVTIFSFVQFLSGVSPQSIQMDGLEDYINNIKWLLYPISFIFLFVMTTLLIFLRISLYAVGAYAFLMLFKKKGDYRHIWRTSAFAITWSVIFSIIFELTPIGTTLATFISIVVTMSLLFLAIKKYPNRTK